MSASRGIKTLVRLGGLTVLAFLIFLATASLVSSAPTPIPQGPSGAVSSAPKIDEAAEGERRFRNNCGRCHHPPEDLSPREARAVIRQMRVRAMLTAEDERLILKFLAP